MLPVEKGLAEGYGSDGVGRLEEDEGYPVYGVGRVLTSGIGVSYEALIAEKADFPGLGFPEADCEVPGVSVSNLSIDGDVLVPV